jgi:hypothetical protein
MYVVGADGVIVARFSTSRTTIMGDGGMPVFDISTNGATEDIRRSQAYPSVTVTGIMPKSKAGSIIGMDYWVLVNGEHQKNHTTFTSGTTETQTVGTDVTIKYISYADRDYFKVVYSGATQKCGITKISWVVQVELPVFTLGTRDESEGVGGFSATIGEGLIASQRDQTVVGAYNENDTGDDYVFIAGNGTSDSNRSNAFTVDWNGNVKAAGHVSGTYTDLTITPINNPYVPAAYVGYMKAVRKDGMLWFNGNITFGTAMPSGTDWIEIAKISNWSAPYSVYATVAGQYGDGNLLVMVTEGGSVQILNRSGSTVRDFHRCPMVAPATD